MNTAGLEAWLERTLEPPAGCSILRKIFSYLVGLIAFVIWWIVYACIIPSLVLICIGLGLLAFISLLNK